MRGNTPARFLGLNDTRLAGRRNLVTVANPAAGADWSVSVPGGRMWRIIAGNCTFTASVNAANRFPGLSFTWQGATYMLQRSSVAITASIVINLCFGEYLSAQASNTTGATVSLALPGGWIPDTATVASSTGAINATDQYSGIALVVEEIWTTDQDLTDWELDREAMIAEVESELTQATPAVPAGG